MVTRDESLLQAALSYLEAKIRVETERVLAEHALPASAPVFIDGRRWMTDVEVAEYTRVSVDTLRDWRRKDAVIVLPYHHLGRLIRYDQAEVDSALDAGRVDP